MWTGPRDSQSPGGGGRHRRPTHWGAPGVCHALGRMPADAHGLCAPGCGLGRIQAGQRSVCVGAHFRSHFAGATCVPESCT